MLLPTSTRVSAEFAVPTLRQCLEALPHRDVRGIATRLGVRRRDEHRKAGWIEGILQTWLASAGQAQIIAGLSPAARQAAIRLAQGGEFPAQLFLAEYGAVRRSRPAQRWLPPPWEAPQTISEELYYCGLLAATPPALLEKAVRLTLPADLQFLFAADALLGCLPASPDDTNNTAAALLHDVAQVLCFLIEQPGLTLLHGRWLAPAALAELNDRLLRPEPGRRRVQQPRSHARAPRLRFLFFLATAAGLHSCGSLTPLGWTWLAEPPALRLTLLWNAWCTAPLALRQAYRQATAALPEPWPDLALRHVARLPPPVTAAQLAQAVLGQETAFAAYFTAHLPDISALDAATASLIETLAKDWGALAPAGSADSIEPFKLTAVGHWLMDPAHGDLPARSFANDAALVTRLSVQGDATWQLTVSPWVPPLHLARLAAYASHVALAPAAASFGKTRFRPEDQPKETSSSLEEPVSGRSQGNGEGEIVASRLDPPYHIYRLDEAAVAAAAAAGHGLPALVEALAGLGVQLSPAQLVTLQAWHARGHELQLLVLPLLRAARPELLAQLHAYADVRAGLGELLSPTVAVAALPPADLAARLRAAGFFPQGPGTRDQESHRRCAERWDRSQEPENGAPASRPQHPASTPAKRAVQSPAVLWLAGQLYAALSEHTTLPLPPPFADLTALLAALPPLDQAVIQAHWETVRNDLLALLDGRTFAPPPQPSDPARWRPLIESAVATGRALTMHYFTAGRNVLTQRTVTPYWIEEHRGIPYLRADCHLAGRVRLFRLDRIQELVEG
jgi:hypothetical protein